MRLDINLATHPYEDQRRFWLRWGSALAFLGLVTLVLLYAVISGWVDAHRTRALINQAQQQIAERNQEKVNAEATLNKPENRSTRDESQFLNDLFQRKAFSWTRVFEDLEKVMPGACTWFPFARRWTRTISWNLRWWWAAIPATRQLN